MMDLNLYILLPMINNAAFTVGYPTYYNEVQYVWNFNVT